MPTKADIIVRLQKEVLSLQKGKPLANNFLIDAGRGIFKGAFPTASFPLAAVHEFFCSSAENRTASSGFVAGLLAPLLQNTGVLLWISCSPIVFPPALKAFGIEPHDVIFLYLKKEKDALWAVEEALKCSGVAAVVAEVPEVSYIESRRLQLAAAQSGVTAFILRQNPRNLTTACVTRWRITALPSATADLLPGVTRPCWNVELVKVRNGKPGTWQLEWAAGSFRPVYRYAPTYELQKKAS